MRSELACGHARAGSGAILVTVQAADLAVAEPVEHQRQQLAGGGDAADVAASAFRDALVVLSDDGPPWKREIASTAAQRTSAEPCFVIGPRWTFVSDSR